MTTIATDGVTIAAESRHTRGHEIIDVVSPKLVVLDNVIYAACGSTFLNEALIDWHRNGQDPTSAPKAVSDDHWSLLVIDRDGFWFYINDTPYPLRTNPPVSMGSGRDWAMGAMLAGASAEDAVRIACTKDVWSGGEIQVVNIAEALAPARLPTAVTKEAAE